MVARRVLVWLLRSVLPLQQGQPRMMCPVDTSCGHESAPAEAASTQLPRERPCMQPSNHSAAHLNWTKPPPNDQEDLMLPAAQHIPQSRAAQSSVKRRRQSNTGDAAQCNAAGRAELRSGRHACQAAVKPQRLEWAIPTAAASALGSSQHQTSFLRAGKPAAAAAAATAATTAAGPAAGLQGPHPLTLGVDRPGALIDIGQRHRDADDCLALLQMTQVQATGSSSRRRAHAR